MRPRPRAFRRMRQGRAFGRTGWPRFARPRVAPFGGGWPGWLREYADGWRRRAVGDGSPAWARTVPGLLAVVAAVVLAGLAIRAVGGTHGHESDTPASGPQRVIARGAVRVPVPRGWSRGDRVPRLPGVAIADPVVLDNRATSVQAVVGLAPATSPTLLPAGFVDGLDTGLPEPQKVQIGHGLRGYHYAGLVHPGVTRLVDMYVAPTTLGTVTVACVARAVESLVDGCLDVVSGLGISGRGRPLPANRLAAFREVLAGRIAALDAVGSRVRGALKSATTRAEQVRALAPLAPAYREAAASVASLAPRSPAWPGRIVNLLRRTGQAYEAYARSVGSGDLESDLKADARLIARRGALRQLLARFSTLPIVKGDR